MCKTLNMALLFALGAGLAAVAQTDPPQTKVGIIHIQNAIISTSEGQKAASELQERYDPTRKRLEDLRNEIAGLQDKLNRGGHMMSQEAVQTLQREIEDKSRTLNRITEDASMDFEHDQNQILQDLGQKLMAVINKYARDNGYALILDISSPQTPVLYAANAIDITEDIITLYDQNAPAGGSAATPAPPKPAPAK